MLLLHSSFCHWRKHPHRHFFHSSTLPMLQAELSRHWIKAPQNGSRDHIKLPTPAGQWICLSQQLGKQLWNFLLRLFGEGMATSDVLVLGHAVPCRNLELSDSEQSPSAQRPQEDALAKPLSGRGREWGVVSSGQIYVVIQCDGSMFKQIWASVIPAINGGLVNRTNIHNPKWEGTAHIHLPC